jgi:serine protease Do
MIRLLSGTLFVLPCFGMARIPLRRTRVSWLSVTRLFLAGVLVGGAMSTVMYERFTSRVPSAQAMLSSSPVRPELDQPPSLAGVATTAAQSVVYIATHKKRQEPQEFFLGSDALKDKEQLQELLRQLYGDRAVRPEEANVGSGFIVSRDGEILTNHHVIADAEEITVRLATQEEYSAQIVGIDTLSDLALIKITAPFAFSALPLGDSNKVHVGDWVMAAGSPFGLEQTVTTEIVSGKGRVIGAGPYDDFIQTDASINPGNSSGPLLNLRGEVVGISSAIVGGHGVNIGIGFATPIDVGKAVIAQLREYGQVIRGWIGIKVRPTPILSSPQLLGPLQLQSGALITEVDKEGPAEDAGLQIGDIIWGYNGRPLTNSYELLLLISRTPVGIDVEVSLVRQQNLQTRKVKIGKLIS